MAREALDPIALARALGPAYGEGTVEALRRLSGGASRETWAFDLVTAAGPIHELVLRRDPGESAVGSSERSTEYALLEAAAGAGVRVPRVVHLLDASDGLGRGFVMERVAGETIARRILRDAEYAEARRVLAAQCGQVAAAIHAVDVGALPALTVEGAAEQIARYRSTLDMFGEPHPAFELGLRWLSDNAPPPTATALVHGDFRNGNFIVGPEGLRAVLDWELAHIGDPIEDLGWLCVKSWRFGVVDELVGGFGDIPELLDAYEAAGGRKVDEDTLRYWVAFGTLKWGVICIAQAFTHIGGMQRSVELATLGRRVAEMEWDLLGILDGGW